MHGDRERRRHRLRAGLAAAIIAVFAPLTMRKYNQER